MEMLRLLLGAFFHKLVDKPAVRVVGLEDLPVAKDLPKKSQGDWYADMTERQAGLSDN